VAKRFVGHARHLPLNNLPTIHWSRHAPGTEGLMSILMQTETSGIEIIRCRVSPFGNSAPNVSMIQRDPLIHTI
jgi:hypothetical protein